MNTAITQAETVTIAPPGVLPIPMVYPGGARVGADEEAAVVRSIRSRRLFRYYGAEPGPSRVAGLEAQLQEEFSVPHALALGSGTASLVTCLAALGVGPGDEVIVPAYGFVSSASCVLAAGAVPVIAEIDESYCLDPTQLEARISGRTRAIVLVHMRGAPADVDPVLEIARRRGVAVVEDTAQSLGATYRGRRLGTIADMGAFSLQYNKVITSGEGGIVLTSDTDLYQRAVMFHDVASCLRAEMQGVAPISTHNMRMSELEGAVAAVQLGRLPSILHDTRRMQREVIDSLGDLLEGHGVSRRRANDPGGDIGICLILMADDPARARSIVEHCVRSGIEALLMYDPERVDLHVAPHWTFLSAKRWWSAVSPWDIHGGDVHYDDSVWGGSMEILSRSVHIDLNPDLTSDQAGHLRQTLRDAILKTS